MEKEIKVNNGEVWQLGRHRLMCGDCTKPSNVERLMKGEKADLFLTDPPYNVNYEGVAGKIKNDNMNINELRLFLAKSFYNANESMKNGASFYIWHADSEGYSSRGACNDISWKIRQCLIWCKNSFVMGRQPYHWRHEPCLFGWKEGSAHVWNSDRKQSTVLEFKRPISSKLHPTMKPIPLFKYLINNSTKEEAIVLDLFAGSGTTIMACEEMNRTAYVMEIESDCCQVIIQRFIESYPNEHVEKIF